VACPTGEWTQSSRFTIANWDTVTGQPVDKEVLASVPKTQKCDGKPAPKPRLIKVKVKGPNKVKRNKKTTFKVKVRNGGKKVATAKKVRVVGKGAAKGKSKAVNIPGGTTKKIKVKLKVKGKKGKKALIKVKAKGKNTNAKFGKKRVKLK
jgi:CARDB